jgi:xanthine dehydrogenase accessory factor
MSKEKCVLVCGIGETASAVARRLFTEDYAVAIHQGLSPRTLRRRMSFADAWFDGFAALKGVEARRADISSEFLLGLNTGRFIPVLRHPFTEVVERWPWDVIVAAPEGEALETPRLLDLAEVTIGVGTGFVAGLDCDLVVSTDGPDPGAILRSNVAPPQRRPGLDFEALENCDVLAPSSGVFRGAKIIGTVVEAGEILGFVGADAVCAPVSGRIKGVIRREQAVVAGSVVAEVALLKLARVTGVSDRNQLISRGVAFAVEMELEGWIPVSF